MGVQSYRDLLVWTKGMDLVVECYKLSEAFPKTELYGLTSQLQRSAVSIPANIAEGATRQYTPEFIQHLSIAIASLAELETHIQIACRLRYVDSQKVEEILEHTEEISKMIMGLIKSLRKKLTIH